MESAPMPMCPMAGTCKKMMNKPFSGMMLTAPGIVFIVLGIAVLVEPRILAWLIAIVFIAMGAGMLMVGRLMRDAGR